MALSEGKQKVVSHVLVYAEECAHNSMRSNSVVQSAPLYHYIEQGFDTYVADHCICSVDVFFSLGIVM